MHKKNFENKKQSNFYSRSDDHSGRGILINREEIVKKNTKGFEGYLKGGRWVEGDL